MHGSPGHGVCVQMLKRYAEIRISGVEWMGEELYSEG